MRKIILASGSPRRKKLLQIIGLRFEVEESNYPEDLTLDMQPEDLVKFLSLKKAETVAKNHKDAIIIGSDTVVILDKKVYGKPENNEDAKKMLRELSGKTHDLITAYTVIDTKKGKTVTDSDKALVTFKNLSEEEIDWYVESGEPMDKAGGYASQERGMIFVEKIHGNFSTIVGLPVLKVIQVLQDFGIQLSDLKKKV